MYKAVLFLCTILLSGCTMNKTNGRLMLEWKEGGQLPSTGQKEHIGVAGPVAGISDDRLIIAGGANFPNGMPWEGGEKTYQKDAYVYKIDLDGKLIPDMAQPFGDSIAYSANTSFAGYIYAVGGERKGVATADVYRYSLKSNQLLRDTLPSLPLPLTNGGAVYSADALYMIGGENSELVSDKIYRLDLSKGATMWEEFAVLPHSVSHAMVVSDNTGNIIIAGGRKRNPNLKSTIYDKVYRLNIPEGDWIELPALPYPLAAGTALCYQNTVILFGGDDGSTFHQVEELLGAINRSESNSEKQELIAKKNTLQRHHPGFRKNVWAMSPTEGTWYSLDDIPGDSPVTTTAILKDNLVLIPSGEVKAGVRTKRILVGSLTYSTGIDGKIK